MGWRHKAPPEALRARFKPRTRPERCESGKIAYLTRGAAMRALMSCKRAGRGERRPYKCESCHQFHLTRQKRR